MADEKTATDGYIYFASFHESTKVLDDCEYGKLMRAINEYAFYGCEPGEDITGVLKMAFGLIKPNIDASKKKRAEYLQAIEYGKRGGAQKGNRNAAKKQSRQPPLDFENNPPLFEKTTPDTTLETTPETTIIKDIEKDKEGNGERKNNVDKNKEKERVVSSFSDNKKTSETIHEGPPPEQKAASKEDATIVFQMARELWNRRNLKPQCRDLIIPPAKYDCLRTFQNYSWLEIENAIKNFHWHKTGQCGPGWVSPPPYGSIYGFLEKGVERYFDDDALEPQFREREGSHGDRK